MPCLDVDAGRVDKGVNFVGLRDAGDPVELAHRRYDAEGADELTFLDITASLGRSRNDGIEVVRRTAERVFIPLTVGGGVRTSADVDALLRAGADKVGVNTAAVARPELSAKSRSASDAGARPVVWTPRRLRGAAPTPRFRGDDPRRPPRHRDRRGPLGGRAAELGGGRDPAQLDGRRRDQGRFDLELISLVRAAVSVPVIASGGAARASTSSRGRGRRRCGACGERLPFGVCTVGDVKDELARTGIPVR